MALGSGRRTSDLGDVIELMRLFWAIEHLLRRTSKLLHRRIGITGPQRLVLRIIEQRSGITASELVGAIHLHKSTLTGILNRLEQRHLLVREPDAADRRRMCLRLSRKGARNPSSRGPDARGRNSAGAAKAVRPAETVDASRPRAAGRCARRSGEPTAAVAESSVDGLNSYNEWFEVIHSRS
jgi:MarR family protein